MRLNADFVDPMTLHWYAEDFITENSSLDRLKMDNAKSQQSKNLEGKICHGI